MPRLIGAHTIDNGGIAMAARRAGSAGMTALQIFSAVPKFYNEKVGVKPERLTAFHGALAAAGIARDAVIVHAGYVLNCATPEAEKWNRASLALTKELERSTALQVRGVCFHPGAATDQDRAAGVARVAAAMTQALETIDGDTGTPSGARSRRWQGSSPRSRSRCVRAPAMGWTPATCSRRDTTSAHRGLHAVRCSTPSRQPAANRRRSCT
jgi:endonuclease IV